MRVKGKEKIFKESLEVFINNGFDGTPMSLIVKKTTLSNGALYHHFKSKEELIRELYIYIKQGYLSELEKNFEAEEGTKEQLLRIWKNSIIWSMNNPKEQFFINMFVNSKYNDETMKKFSQVSMEFLNNVFNRGLKGGILDDNLGLEYIKSYMYGATQGVRGYLKYNKEENLEDFLNKVFESFWKSIKK